MKICHFADTHIGGNTDGPTDPETGLKGRVLDFLDSLDVMIDYCIDNDADIALFAGDAFHKHSPNPVLLNEFTKRIHRLSEHCPVVLLVGNHDATYGSADKVSSIEVYNSLQLKNILIGNKYEVIAVETKSGIIQIATFPYPWRKLFPRQKDISNKIKELEKCVDDMYPAVFLGHFGLQGAKVSIEPGYIISDDAQLNTSWLSRGPWDYVALGHIHNYQCMNEGEVPPVVYAGSIDRVNFGEEKGDKGFVWVEINKKDMDFYFVSVSPRRMVSLDYEFKDTDRHITTKIVNDINERDLVEAIVRVRIKVPERLATSIQAARIYEALESCYHVHAVNISRISAKPVSRLGEDVDSTTLISRPSLELVDMFFTSVRPVPEKEKQELMKLAKEIMEESYE